MIEVILILSLLSNVFLLAKLSSPKYDGEIKILGKGGDGRGNFTLSLPEDAHTIENAKEIRLKVVPPVED